MLIWFNFNHSMDKKITFRIIYGLPLITMLSFPDGSPMIFISDTVTSENYWRITFWVTKNSLFMATHILFYFLHAFRAHRHREIDENSHRSITAPLLFTVGQSAVVLWRLANTQTPIVMPFWPIARRTILTGSRASLRRRRQVDYHSLIIQ